MRRWSLAASSLARLRAAFARFDARFPIGLKLAVPIVGLGLVSALLFALVVYRMESGRIRSDFEERALVIAGGLESQASLFRARGTEEDFRSHLEEHIDALVLSNEESLLLINVYGIEDGTSAVVASSDPGLVDATGLGEAQQDIEALYAAGPLVHEEELEGENALEVSLPVRVEGAGSFVVGAYFSTAERDAALAGLLRNVVSVALIVMVVVLAVVFSLFRVLVLGRLRALMTATSRVERGDYSARVRGVLPPDAKDEMVRLASRFNGMAEAVETLHARVSDLAIRDELTGLHNRRYAVEALEREVSQARRSGRSLGLIILDVDGLKAINDQFGHAAGDDALRRVARAMRNAARAGDLPVRFGGDEFLLVLPDCDGAALRVVLDRIEREIEKLGARNPGDATPVHLTVSAGGTVVKGDDTIDAVIQRADLALYEAKRAGRSQTRVAA
ncbi:MAG: GGDEF domain-containing protein [Dehalococcoidia bacterium]|nr:GGDEF domain-containing protein [Dehalococcoidia bacterium]